MLYVNDSLRRIRVDHIIKAGKLNTGKDSIVYCKAVKFMKMAIEKDATIHKRLYAAAIDRYLLSTGEPQIYGTQYGKIVDGPWKLDPIDTTKISDIERKHWHKNFGRAKTLC